MFMGFNFIDTPLDLNIWLCFFTEYPLFFPDEKKSDMNCPLYFNYSSTDTFPTIIKFLFCHTSPNGYVEDYLVSKTVVERKVIAKLVG